MNSDNLKKDNKKIHTQYIKAFYRHLGDYMAPIFKKFNIKANYLTASRIVFVLLAAVLILFDTTLSKIIVFLCLLFFSALDMADGSLARITTTSSFGMWLDTVIDRLGLILIFLALSHKIYISVNLENYLIIINFLVLIIFFINYTTLSDIRYKPKYQKFRDINEKLNYKSNFNLFRDGSKEINVYSFNFLLKNFSIKNLMKFLFHQFSPHSSNLILYISIINLLSLYQFGLIILLVFLILMYFYNIYKLTLTSLKIDNNEPK